MQFLKKSNRALLSDSTKTPNETSLMVIKVMKSRIQKLVQIFKILNPLTQVSVN